MIDFFSHDPDVPVGHWIPVPGDRVRVSALAAEHKYRASLATDWGFQVASGVGHPQVVIGLAGVVRAFPTEHLRQSAAEHGHTVYIVFDRPCEYLGKLVEWGCFMPSELEKID